LFLSHFSYYLVASFGKYIKIVCSAVVLNRDTAAQGWREMGAASMTFIDLYTYFSVLGLAIGKMTTNETNSCWFLALWHRCHSALYLFCTSLWKNRGGKENSFYFIFCHKSRKTFMKQNNNSSSIYQNYWFINDVKQIWTIFDNLSSSSRYLTPWRH